jgi:hypothetical protein
MNLESKQVKGDTDDLSFPFKKNFKFLASLAAFFS